MTSKSDAYHKELRRLLSAVCCFDPKGSVADMIRAALAPNANFVIYKKGHADIESWIEEARRNALHRAFIGGDPSSGYYEVHYREAKR